MTIILGSFLARVFSGIVEARITKIIPLSKRQIVFVEGIGIAANILALDLAIRRGKTSRLSLAVLDVSKAFDCVPHEVILRALFKLKRNVYVQMVKSMKTEFETKLKNCDGAILKVRRGVKQGDSLSYT